MFWLQLVAIIVVKQPIGRLMATKSVPDSSPAKFNVTMKDHGDIENMDIQFTSSSLTQARLSDASWLRGLTSVINQQEEEEADAT